MAWAPDSPDSGAPDSWLSAAWAPDSDRRDLRLGRAVDLFLTAEAAEGVSPKTIEWYRMVLGRAARDLGADRALDGLAPAELRDWLLTLRSTLAPVSVAGYVRGLKVFGNWCAAEEWAAAKAMRSLRRPRVPHKLVEPLTDETLRRLLDGASVRDRAIVLLFLDTGLRLSELAGLRVVDLRPDGSVKVMGKGARERIVPVGTVAPPGAGAPPSRSWGSRGRPADLPLGAGQRSAGSARGPAGLRAAQGARRDPRSLQPTHPAPHLRPLVCSMVATHSACSASWATPRSTWSSVT